MGYPIFHMRFLDGIKILFLWPVSLIYGSAIALRNLAYQAGIFKSQKAAIPVISVGNIVAGGTGKTPMVILLARLLMGKGLRVAVLTRGYRRSLKKNTPGPLVVSDGISLKCGPAEAGDEPFLMASRLLGGKGHPGALVIVGKDRVAGAKKAAEMGVRVVIMDDGFQHRRLIRDMDIVLLDGDRPRDNGWLLPVGRLREQPSALKRAGIIVATRCGNEIGCRNIDRLKRSQGLTQPVFFCRHKAVKLRSDERQPSVNLSLDNKLLLFSGIARPDSFEDSVKSLGYSVGKHLIFGDHHSYDQRDLMDITLVSGGYDAVVTTEKDAVKLPPGWNPGRPLFALEIEMAFNTIGEEEKMIEIIVEAIKG